MTIGWTHPQDGANKWKGINDPGMEWFRGEAVIKFTREGIQNSLDSASDSDENPVVVQFNLLEVETNSIPNIDDLKTNTKNALWSHTNRFGDSSTSSKKVVNTYERSLNILNKEKISIFQISDSNTTGMTPDDFFIYVKGEGLSAKDEGKGGSFGIGKMAPFVVSDLKVNYPSFSEHNNLKSVII